MCFAKDSDLQSNTLISSLYKQTCSSLTPLYLGSAYRFGLGFAFRHNMLLRHISWREMDTYLHTKLSS